MDSEGALKGEALNAALTNSLVGIQTAHLDLGPAKALAFCRGNVVVAVMHDVLNKAERLLAENGNHSQISESRRLFRQTMEGDFRAAVEQLTGRKVVAFMGDTQLKPDVSAEIFVLDTPL